MNKARESGPYAHTLIKGRAPVWGFEFTTKAATLQGGSAEFHFEKLELYIFLGTPLPLLRPPFVVADKD
jgi:hypothetical protein